jgi:hypothetical protein
MKRKCPFSHDCSRLAGCSYREIQENVYQCVRTKQIHHCGKECSQRYINHDSTTVCKISGRCFDQVIQSHPFAKVQTLKDVCTVVPVAPDKKKDTHSSSPKQICTEAADPLCQISEGMCETTSVFGCTS